MQNKFQRPKLLQNLRKRTNPTWQEMAYEGDLPTAARWVDDYNPTSHKISFYSPTGWEGVQTGATQGGNVSQQVLSREDEGCYAPTVY